MIHALGFSDNEFSPSDPGRLCRGRERWIEPWEAEEDAESPPPLHRLVVSGAAFDDDSARDAVRGVEHSGVDLPSVIATLFPRKTLVAFMEDGHPADIPAAAEGVEAYEAHRAGGSVELGMVRWHMPVSGVRDIRALVGDQGEARVRGFVVADNSVDDEQELLNRVFVLVGMSTLDSPPARFQPSALLDLLEVVRAVILLHRDKHGTAVGVYSHKQVKVEDRLRGMCAKSGSLFVPFAIPPMLARWDRALFEMRQAWDADEEAGEFPVPRAPEGQSWDGRRRRRRREDRGSASSDSAPPDDPASEPAGAEPEPAAAPVERSAALAVDLDDDDALLAVAPVDAADAPPVLTEVAVAETEEPEPTEDPDDASAGTSD